MSHSTITSVRARRAFHHPGKALLSPSEESTLSIDTESTDATELTSSSSSEDGVGEQAVGAKSSQTPSDEQAWSETQDFLWMYTEEPHRSRRVAILKTHPEVRKLMGPTRWTFPIVLLVLGTQISLALYTRRFHPLSLPFLLTAYAAGGALNQNTFLAIHEITHNLAFKSIRANKLLAIVANLAIGVPYAMAFKGYHIEHHKFLGENGIDTDLPSRLEALVLNNVAGKTFFATFQIFFYALRPGFVRSQRPTVWHALNLAAILTFDYVLVRFAGWRPMLYLLFSSFFAGSLHPCAAHFIAEHYIMNEPEAGVQSLAQETTSYYGKLNWLCYNVGYHNEHHDFPSVPWTRLPALRALAHEYYDDLPAHRSWPAVTWKFITDPSIGMWSRAKRTGRGEPIDEGVWRKAAASYVRTLRRAAGTAGGGRAARSRDGESEDSTSESERSEDSVSTGAEDEHVLRQADEATEIGYGSDRD
ncbi:sphingolipid delta-4 desaturase [Cryptotrichosporon argae]